jgi:hypothetical protein
MGILQCRVWLDAGWEIRYQFPESLFDRIDGPVRCGGPGGEADRPGVGEPVEAEVAGGLYVMHTATMRAAGSDEFARVVALKASDHEHHVRLPGQFDGRLLALFRGLADRIDKPHFSVRESALERAHERPDPVDGLGGLGHDPVTVARLQAMHIVLSQHDVEALEISGQTTNFDVLAQADDHGMKTAIDEAEERAMRVMDQRASGLQDDRTVSVEGFQGASGGAVRSDHHGAGGDGSRIGLDTDPQARQVGEDTFVMHELTENGERFLAGAGAGELDGVAHAEAHAEMFSADDLHRCEWGGGGWCRWGGWLRTSTEAVRFVSQSIRPSRA